MIASRASINCCARYFRNYYPTLLMIPDRDSYLSCQMEFLIHPQYGKCAVLIILLLLIFASDQDFLNFAHCTN